MSNEAIEAEVLPNRAVAVRENMAVGQAMSVDDIIAQVDLIQNVMRKVMVEGEHFGKIPGCGEKKVLMQPGAQKLCMTFRLAPQYEIQEVDLPRGHKEYRIKCTLLGPNGNFVGQGVGACSSMESKYRYRGGARKCPECGKESIIKGKAEYGGGWLCFTKKGGCGAKWEDGSQEIEGQSIDKAENDNPADTFNTVLKMAKKRAFVDATITATAASDIFAQDLEENNLEGGENTAAPRPAAATSPNAKPSQTAPAPSSNPSKPTSPVAQRTWREAYLQTAAKGGEIWAWKLAIDDGWIMPNEKLSAISDTKVPKNNAEFEAWKARVGALKAQGVTQELQEAWDAVNYDPDDQVPGAAMPPPAEPKPAPTNSAKRDPEWFLDVIVPVPHKGEKRDIYMKNPDTIGSLYEAAANDDEEAGKRLFGFVSHYEPKGWTGNDGKQRPPSASDKLFREALDAFADWRDAKQPA